MTNNDSVALRKKHDPTDPFLIHIDRCRGKKKNPVHFADRAVQHFAQVYSIGLQDQILQMFADQGVIVSTVLLGKARWRRYLPN